MGIGIERCDCPEPPDGDRCIPLSNKTVLRLYQALNDKQAWQELSCFLDDLCEGLNDIPDVIIGKDSNGGPIFRAPVGPSPVLAGQPVFIDATGAQRIATFVTATSAMVCGLTEKDTAALGSGCVVASGCLTLPDWTAVTGSALLTPGATYYLAASGGLTAVVPVPPTEAWNVHVGHAASGTKFIIDPRTPLQLVC